MNSKIYATMRDDNHTEKPRYDDYDPIECVHIGNVDCDECLQCDRFTECYDLQVCEDCNVVNETGVCWESGLCPNCELKLE